MNIKTIIKNVELEFVTDDELFSPKEIDRGTLAMLSTVDFKPTDRVLDLGCGYGVVGILAGRLVGPDRVVMVDVNAKAVELAKKNAILNGLPELSIFVSDGLENIHGDQFTYILNNPPYHEDFSIPKRFIEEGFKALAVGGRMVMVVKRLLWYKNKLTSVFGGVKVDEIDEYFILTAEKRSQEKVKVKKEKNVSSKHLKKVEASSKKKKRLGK